MEWNLESCNSGKTRVRVDGVANSVSVVSSTMAAFLVPQAVVMGPSSSLSAFDGAMLWRLTNTQDSKERVYW